MKGVILGGRRYCSRRGSSAGATGWCWEVVRGEVRCYREREIGEENVGVRWQVALVRTITRFCFRAPLTRTSWEIASHHFAADTLSAASLGPDIQAQDRSLMVSVLSCSVFARGPEAFAGRWVLRTHWGSFIHVEKNGL